MQTPQRSQGQTAEGGGSGRRVVRSALESLAVTTPPSMHDTQRAPHDIPRRPFTEVSTRTNRSRAADAPPTSALEHLSPPSKIDRALQMLTGGPRARSVPPASSPSSRGVPPTAPVLAVQGSSPGVVSREAAERIVRERLDQYAAERDEAEERILQQLTAELTGLRAINDTLQQENTLLTQQLEDTEADASQSRSGSAQLERGHAVEVERYKKAVSLLKAKCADLARAVEEGRAEHAAAMERAAARTRDDAATQEQIAALHAAEMRALRESMEEAERSHGAETRILRAQLDKEREDSEALEAILTKVNAELDTQTSEIFDLKKQLDERQHQLSAERSKSHSAVQQRSVAEQSKREEAKHHTERLRTLEEACKNQTDDIRKKLHKIAVLEAARDENRHELREAQASLARLADHMALLTQSCTQLSSATRDLEQASGDGDGSGRGGRPKSVAARSTGDPASKDPFAMLSDAVQRLQHMQLTVRNATARMAELRDRTTALQQLADAAAASRDAALVDCARVKGVEGSVAEQAALHDKQEAVLRARLEAAAEHAERLQHDVAGYKEQLAAATASRDVSAATVAELQGALKDARGMAHSLREDVAAAERRARDTADGLATAEAAARKAQSHAELAEDRAQRAERDLQSTTASAERLTRQLKGIREERAELEEVAAKREKDLAVVQGKVRTLEAQLSAQRKRGASAHTVEELRAKVSALEAELAANRTLVDELRAAGAAVEQRHASQLAAVADGVREGAAAEAACLRHLHKLVHAFVASSVEPLAVSCRRLAQFCGSPAVPPPSPWGTGPALGPLAESAASPRRLRADACAAVQEVLGAAAAQLHPSATTIDAAQQLIAQQHDRIMFMEIEAVAAREASAGRDDAPAASPRPAPPPAAREPLRDRSHSTTGVRLPHNPANTHTFATACFSKQLQSAGRGRSSASPMSAHGGEAGMSPSPTRGVDGSRSPVKPPMLRSSASALRRSASVPRTSAPLSLPGPMMSSTPMRIIQV